MNHVDHLTGSSNDSLELFGSGGSMTPFFFLFFGETCSNSSYSWHMDRGEGEAKRVRTLNTRVKWLGWGENSKSGAPVTGRRRKSFTVVRKLACRGKLSLSLSFSLSRFLSLPCSPFVSDPSLHTGPPLFRLFPSFRREIKEEGAGSTSVWSSHCLCLKFFRAYPPRIFLFSFQTSIEETSWMTMENWEEKYRVIRYIYIHVSYCNFVNDCCFNPRIPFYSFLFGIEIIIYYSFM